MRRRFPLFVICLSAAAVAPASGNDWWTKNIFSKIQLTGYRQLAYHQHQVEGDRDAFNSLTYYGQGEKRFTDTGQVGVTARDVLGFVNFDAVITDSRFKDPQTQRFSLNYKRNGWSADAGDIYGSLLNTNAFASFSKSLKGISLGYQRGRFGAKVLRSDTKGAARTVSLQGINSTGPYYLASSQIIQGSESVLVDGMPMSLGTDYVISYEIGAITFVNRIIPPTSTILVTYEALDFNSSPGTLTGAGLSYDFGRAGRLGFTTIQQQSRSRGGLSSRVEQFEGFGAASTPYFLQFEPLNTAQYPTTIRLDGVLQIVNVDYAFDVNNKSIFYFKRFVPSTSIVDVTYFPKPTSLTDGDRRVVGVDYRIPLKSNGSYLQFSQATGSLLSDVTPLKGSARGVQGLYKFGKWEFTGSARDIPETFVGIETRGFTRNERAVNLGVEYKAKGFRYGGEHVNSDVSSRTTQQDGTFAFSHGRQTRTNAFAEYASDKWTYHAEQSRRTTLVPKGETKLDTTSIYASRKYGKLDTRYTLDHQTGMAPNGAGVASKLALDSLRFDADYQPTKRWSLGLRTGLSKVRYDGQSGNGHDVTLSTSYRPNAAWLFDASMTNSDSGAISSLGSFSGSIGYDGNGFSSGAIGSAFTPDATNLKLWNLHGRYESGGRLNGDFRAYYANSSGSLYTNTETKGFSVGFDYDFGRAHSISLNFDQTETRFLDSTNRSNTRSLGFGFSGRPNGPWGYRLGANIILSGGTSDFAQDVFNFDGTLSYRINNRNQVYGQFNSGRTTGYLPQTEGYAGLFYEYRIWKNLALVGSYKVRNTTNQDPFSTSGAYRSRGFDIELSFNFGG